MKAGHKQTKKNIKETRQLIKLSRQHVQVLLNVYKVAFELNFKFTESVSICLMFPGRVFYVRGPFILKLPWYLTVSQKEGTANHGFLVL